MVLRILGTLAVLLVVFLAWVATRPAGYRVERSASIEAPAAAIHAQVADFHRWSAWSPWEKLDPGMQRTFSGPQAGKGARYAWTGNKKVGEGNMTMLDADPAKRAEIRLEFVRPFAAVCRTVFTFAPQGDETRVTWTMEGTSNFVAKAFTVFMDMDKTVGADFDRGLSNLKAVAESSGKEAASR